MESQEPRLFSKEIGISVRERELGKTPLPFGFLIYSIAVELSESSSSSSESESESERKRLGSVSTELLSDRESTQGCLRRSCVCVPWDRKSKLLLRECGVAVWVLESETWAIFVSSCLSHPHRSMRTIGVFGRTPSGRKA